MDKKIPVAFKITKETRKQIKILAVEKDLTMDGVINLLLVTYLGQEAINTDK